MSVDLEQLSRVFARRGERVVLVLPQGEPVVLVPLSEYEQLARDPRAVTPRGQPSPFQPLQPRRGPGRPPASRPQPIQPAAQEPPEAIDPPQGNLLDDDAYFPEPLE
jgi:hypothetical protein